MEEIFKVIKWTAGRYEISNLWRCYSNIRNIFLKHAKDTNWYLYFPLRINGKTKNIQTHILMARAFLPNPNRYTVVHHKNWVKDDNRLENLEWRTHKETISQAWEDWLCPLTDKQIQSRAIMCRKRLSKPIMQITKEWILCRVYDSASEAERALWIQWVGGCAIWKQKSCWWFIWKYIPTENQAQKETPIS